MSKQAASKVNGKLKRISPGYYVYMVNGKHFAIVEVNRREGFPGKNRWNVAELLGNGSDPYRHGDFFDSAETLRDAQHWCKVAAHDQGK